MSVVFTSEAERDLEEIGDFIARDNPARAATFIKELREAAKALAQTPLAYPLVARFERHGIRRRIHGDYLIFYRLRGDQIEILHTLHGARDFGNLLI